MNETCDRCGRAVRATDFDERFELLIGIFINGLAAQARLP
jgi:hypothetical protein